MFSYCTRTRIATVAVALGVTRNGSPLTTAEHGVEFLSQLSRDCGVPQTLSELNIPREAIPAFAKWVELYARDKERFFEDFTKVFAKLVELGIQRDAEGKITNSDNELGGYHAAPKKSATLLPPAGWPVTN